MATINGEIKSKSRAGTGIKVGETWYNGTRSQLEFLNRGDNVELSHDNRTIEWVKASGGGSQKPAAKPAGGGGGRWDPEADRKRQGVIVYQAARNAAIQFAAEGIKAGAIAMPTKAADKFDVYASVIDEYTERYYNDAMSVYETGGLPDDAPSGSNKEAEYAD